MSVPVTADWMVSRFDTPGFRVGVVAHFPPLSVTAERIFLAVTFGSSSRLISPASVAADLLIFDVGSARS